MIEDEKSTPIQIRMGAGDLERIDAVAVYYRRTMPERQWGRSELIRHLIEVAYDAMPGRGKRRKRTKVTGTKKGE